MEGNADSSKDMGHRTNSSGKTVGTGQLRWEGECGNVASPFMILGVTVSGVRWGEEQEPSQSAEKLQFWEKNQYAYIQGYQHGRGPIECLKWHCWKVMRHETKHFKGVLARNIRGPLKVG